MSTCKDYQDMLSQPFLTPLSFPENTTLEAPDGISSTTSSLPFKYQSGWRGFDASSRMHRFWDVPFALTYFLLLSISMFTSLLALAKFIGIIHFGAEQQQQHIEECYNYPLSDSQGWPSDDVITWKHEIPFIFESAALSTVTSILWLQFLKWKTLFFVWITISLALLCALTVFIVCCVTILTTKSSDSVYKEFVSIAVVASFVLFLFLLVSVVRLRDRVSLTSELLALSCDASSCNRSVFLVAGLFSFFAFSSVLIWVSTCVVLLTSWDFCANGGDSQHTFICLFSCYSSSMWAQLLCWISGLSCVWTVALFSAVIKMTSAGAVSHWYFAQHPLHLSKEPILISRPVFSTLARALTFSLGSLAFGSLLVSFVSVASMILRRAKFLAKAVMITCVPLLTFLSVVARVAKMLQQAVNRYAYVFIAMHGGSFTHAASSSSLLISRNKLDVLVCDTITDFLVTSGKVLCISTACLGTVLTLEWRFGYVKLSTLILIIIVAYIVSTIFLNIPKIGTDAVLVCYMEDLERNEAIGLYISPHTHHMLQERSAVLNSDKIKKKKSKSKRNRSNNHVTSLESPPVELAEAPLTPDQ